METENPTPPGEASAPATPAPAESSLQFDRAEFAAGSTISCEICKAPLQGEYFQVNGKNICPACRSKVDAAFIGGSKFARFGKAALAGIGAGFAGFLIYWAVLSLFNLHLSLIAIVVGMLVGRAVRWGANARGGLFYQLMAVAITYAAICSSYVPTIVTSVHSTKVPFLVKVVLAFFIALTIPFQAMDVLLAFIIGIGLWQAWVINRKAPVQITGPYYTAATKAPAA